MGAPAAALNGVRVVDLSDETGELCGRLLADLGADVLRVEPPSGASSRHLPPFAPDGKTSLWFAVRNAGKRGAALDPGEPADRERLHELLDEADLCIESFAPGRLAALGLQAEALLEHHPSLVLVSISDFGRTGPYRDYQGTSMIGFAMGGMLHRAGIPEKPPITVPGSLAYDVAGTTAAFAGLMAFFKRLRTGRGQHVDVSVMESVANLSDWSLPNYSLNPDAIGMRAGAGIYTLYPCADGFVRMIILVTHHWHALLEWMGRPEALADPQLDVFIQRLIRRAEIDPPIARFFADKKKIDVAREAQRRGIPATPLLEPSEVLDNEHTAARETFASIEVAPGVRAAVPSGFFTIDGERAGPGAPPPEPGGRARFAPNDARAKLFDSAPADAAPGEAGPFAGLRVLDFGVGAVGVEIGRLLAEYGADVIKIESRKAPDFIRTIMNTYMNPSFASSSRSKRSFGVDLKSEKGRELVHRLAETADVIVDNNATGVMERFGLGPESLAKRHPHLVSLTSQMVGSSGPWKDWIGYGPSTHPVSGLQYLWNYPEDGDRPAGSTNVYPDHYVARLGAFAIVAGLVRRLRTGRGMHVDAAQFEAAIGLLGDLLARESLAPGSVRPEGNASPLGVPWGVYRCAGEDEWCVINIRTPEHWRALVDELDRPDWAGADLDDVTARRAHAADIDRHLEAWTREQPPRAVMERLQRAGVPAGIVAHAAHHASDPHLEARGYLRSMRQPELGDMMVEGPAFHGSDLPEPRIERAPRLGEHTREIAAHDLGLSLDDIEALVAEAVLEDPPD